MNKNLLLPLILLAVPAFAAADVDAPSVQVKTVALQKQVLSTTIDAYGSVSAAIGASENISFARNIQLARLLVTPGQVVHAGAPLFEVVTDAISSAAYQQAISAEALARSELSRTEDLVSQQLATQSQLATAHKALQDAESALDAQKKLGTGLERQVFKAPFDAIVTMISAQQGDRVQAGAAVLQLSRSGALRAVLGVEPENIAQIRAGMRVNLRAVFGKQDVQEASVTQVTGAINPQTRLVDIVVSLKKPSSNLLPGMQVRGQIITGSKALWTVPRSAVLKDTHGSYLYQVSNQYARRVDVTSSNETARDIGVEGSLNTGYNVVIEGNYELQDGMAVRELKP